MNSPSCNSDTDESGLFCPSIIPKRKASESVHFHNGKKPKLTLQLAQSSDGLSNDKITEAAAVSSVLNSNFTDIHLRDEDSNTITKLIDLKKNCQSDLQENESFSRYFSSEKTSNNCPLCLNSFASNSGYVAHMKQCAKKHKMNTQQVLNALEFQKKKIKEKTLVEPVQKKSIPRKKDKQMELIQYDLSLGLAMSKSLEKNEQNASNKIDEKEEASKELQKFNKVSDLKKKRHKKLRNPMLKERTKEHRQQMVTEKASVLLLEDDDEYSCIVRNKNLNPDLHLSSENLVKFQNKDCRLWNLGENKDGVDWYVEQMMTQILPEHGKELNEGTAKEKCITEFENIHYEIFKPDLPRFSSIDQDWRKMINNECFSDLFAISKDKCKFYLHSLVLSVRCPVILKKDYKFLFAKFNLSIILVFLEYLYCGTLNNLNKAKLKDLMDLGRDFDCKELVDVLNCLEVNLEKTDDDSFNVSEITTKESNNLKTENTIFELEDKDLFEDEVVDLTQSSRESSLVSDGEKLDLSYKNYNHEKEKEKELLEEKNDKLMISFEMEKIQTSMNQQNEIIQKILSEFEEVHTQNSSKSNQPRQLLRRESNYSNTKDVEEFISENKINENCIILSSDSETVESKPDNEKTLGDKRTPETSDCDVSYSEPFHMSDFNFSPVDLNYKSIITGQVSKNNTADLSETLNAHDDGEKKINATSFILRQTCGAGSSIKKSAEKLKKKSLDLSANRIIRKSLCLTMKTPKSSKNKKISNKSAKQRTRIKEKKWMDELTNSIMNDISKSPMFTCSTPVRSIDKDLVEITPCSIRDIEIEEPVTPYPNYSSMGDALLKEHLTKYGLKKSLSKKKAEKILKRIYEELHPYLNEKTGKLVKRVCVETPKNHRKKESKISKRKKISKSKTARKLDEIIDIQKSSDSSQTLIANASNLDRSMEHNSNNSTSEDLSQISSQCKRGKANELHAVMIEFLRINPDMHQNILLYEPIWLKDLQRKLKETFNKHFKRSDLEDYLDQKCITFRSELMQETSRKSKIARLLKKKQKSGS